MITVKYFRAEWCGPCKQQGPIVSDVADHFADDESVSVEKIDVDESPEAANEYNVRSIPTVLVESDGEVVSQSAGVTQFEEIVESVENRKP